MSRLPALGPRGEGWVLIQFVLLGLLAAAGLVSLETGAAGPVLAAAGVALLVAGVALAAKGLLDLRTALTPLPRPREDAELVVHGVYRLVRHPIYGGIVLTAAGWALLRASPAALGVALVLLLFFRLKSAREEVWLAERYPGYAAYAARTRRLIPFLY